MTDASPSSLDRPVPAGSSTAAPDGHELARLRSGLRIMALRALGDAIVAEEVAQETIVRVLTAIREREEADGVKNLGAFAHGVAKRVIAGRYRERSRRVQAPLPAEDGIHAIPAPGPDALSALVAAEDRERMRRALEHLPPADRQLLRRCFFDDLKPGAIAASLGEPAERVRQRKSRALARLRKAFFGNLDWDGADASGGEVAMGPAQAEGR